MSANQVLPPGVSQLLYDALPKSTIFFDGEGQAGNWSDPANWWGGKVPISTNFVLVPVSATLNGSFTTGTVMLLGNETVTVNGVLTTTSDNPCESFMVCSQAMAIFTPGAALNDAGSLIVGNTNLGTFVAEKSGSGTVTITSLNGKIGRASGGVGVMTLDGAHWTMADDLLVGKDGNGTLNVLDGGQVSVGTDLDVGQDSGAAGTVTLSSGATLSVGGSLHLASIPGSWNADGTASVTIGAGAELAFSYACDIFNGGTLTLAGGSLAGGGASMSVKVEQGGTLSGYGTVSAVNGGIYDTGTIIANGGTLLLNGELGGPGTVDIASGSTLDLNTWKVSFVGLDFTGTNSTLELTHDMTDYAPINDFAPGDSIIMPGIDHIMWNATTNMLDPSYEGHALNPLHIVGSYANDHFTLSQSLAGAVITVSAGH